MGGLLVGVLGLVGGDMGKSGVVGCVLGKGREREGRNRG